MSLEKIEDTELESQPRVKTITKKKFTPLLLLVLIIACVLLGFGYYNAKKEVNSFDSPEAQQKITDKEIDDLISRVGKIILLPEERPSVATIQDVDALIGQQPFFIGAENGDKILIFSDKAVIYSPKRDILVNVGPVYKQDQAESPASS